MTNYNERLDEILYRFIPATDYSDKRETDPTDQGRAKQAITSLIKELVAEREYSIEVYFDDRRNGSVKIKKASVKVTHPRNIFSIPIDNYRSVRVVVQELTKGEEK